MKLHSHNLVKRYRGRTVVDGVSIEVHPGEVVGLLGPNGAGKTTTFYMIVGLVRPDGGQVLLDEHDLSHLPMYRRARLGIGYLPQEASIFRKLTVEENITAILQMLGLPKEEQKARLERLLAEFGLEHLRHYQGQVLSGGERRRAEIARTLATEPKFILLDEPFTGVDPIAIADIKDLLEQLSARGIGVLLTDHSVRDTLAVTHRAYIIHQGKILTAGPSSGLADDPIARKFYLGERFEM